MVHESIQLHFTSQKACLTLRSWAGSRLVNLRELTKVVQVVRKSARASFK